MASMISLAQPTRILTHAAPSKSDFYRDVALLRARNGTAGQFSNDSFDNSAAIHEAMFATSKDRVRVIARGIKPEIFENANVIAAALKFVRNSDVSVIFDIRTDLDSKADCEHWFKANRFVSSLLRVKHDTTKVSVSFYLPKKDKKDNDFLRGFGSASLGDDRMYRQRSVQANGDYTSHGRSNVDFCDREKVSQIETRANELLGKECLLANVSA